MSEQPPSPGRDSAKARRDRWVKIAFLLVTIVAVVIIYFVQTNPPLLSDWGGDLPGALKEANARNQHVLVLFVHEPLDETDRWLASNTLKKNDGRIRKGGFLRVKVAVPANLDSNVARDYRIKETPTLLMLAPDGRELGRMVGRIPEMDLAKLLVDPNQR